jgi:hypothetical protein
VILLFKSPWLDVSEVDQPKKTLSSLVGFVGWAMLAPKVKFEGELTLEPLLESQVMV